MSDNNKKRKRNEKDNIIKKHNITELRPIPYLLCDVCQSKVYEYNKCISPYTYCSLDCFELLYLTYFGNFGKKETFEEDDLMLFDK